jgi:pimeloyl-ACP methyl ester carboxylesterase
MEFARSADGTTIAYERSGTGPPLVLVHGALGDRNAWFALAPLLAPHFTLHTIDRRGRGASGDTPPYAVEREVEDILAVLGAIDAPVALFGHSSGAVLSLAAARRTPAVHHLILYEPPIPVDARSARPPEDVQERMRSLLAAGRRDDVVRLTMRLTMQEPDADIDAMQSDPMWPYLTALAHTCPYDMAIWAHPYAPQDLAQIQSPALFLIGELTLPWVKAASETIAALLPNSRIAVMPGQGHLATIAAPDLIATEILRFLSPTP